MGVDIIELNHPNVYFRFGIVKDLIIFVENFHNLVRFEPARKWFHWEIEGSLSEKPKLNTRVDWLTITLQGKMFWICYNSTDEFFLNNDGGDFIISGNDKVWNITKNGKLVKTIHKPTN